MTADTPTGTGRDARVPAIVWTVVTVVPLLAAAVVLFVGGKDRVVPWGDQALLELSVREVGDRVLLVGSYSRFRWHHPGPLLFDWLALPYRALGSRSQALYQGAALSAAISIAVAAWVAFRRGGRALLGCVLVLTGLFLWAVGPDVVRVPWNPWIVILPLFATILLAWDATTGSLWSFPVAVAGGSFVVQSHVGYAGVTAAVLATAGIVVLVRAARGRERWARVGVVALVSVAVLGVLWTPPVYQELRDSPGNLTALKDFFTSTEPDHTLDDGISVTVREVGAVADQLVSLSTGEAERGRPPLWAGIVTLLALVAAAVVAVRRRARDALALVLLVGVSIVAAAWSTSRVVGPIEDYLVLWIAVTGVGVWTALAAACLVPPDPDDGGPDAAPRPEPRWARFLAVPVVALAALNTWSAVRTGPPEPTGTTVMPPVIRRVLAALPPADRGPVLVRIAGDDTWPVAAGTMLALERRGYSTLVERDVGWLLGEGRVVGRDDDPAATVTFADPTESATVRAEPGQREVARERVVGDVRAFVRTG